MATPYRSKKKGAARGQRAARPRKDRETPPSLFREAELPSAGTASITLWHTTFIGDMSDRHLANTMQLIQRSAFIWLTGQLAFGLDLQNLTIMQREALKEEIRSVYPQYLAMEAARRHRHIQRAHGIPSPRDPVDTNRCHCHLLPCTCRPQWVCRYCDRRHCTCQDRRYYPGPSY